MISEKDALNRVSKTISASIGGEFITIRGMARGPSFYAVFTAYNDGSSGPDDDYIVDVNSGSVKPIFKLGWPLEYPEYESWPRIDISKLGKGVS